MLLVDQAPFSMRRSDGAVSLPMGGKWAFSAYQLCTLCYARSFKASFSFILTMVRQGDITFPFQRGETKGKTDSPMFIQAVRAGLGTTVWVFLCPRCLPEGESDETDG